MRKVNLSQVPREHRRSPGGRYELTRQHVSLALGGVKDVGPWGGGLPFDVELTTLPPGARNYPLHAHAAQTEHYLFLSGTGVISAGAGAGEGGLERVQVGPGDHVVCAPGEAHELHNDGAVDLVYYVIADHHPADITTYPRTGKRQLKPEYRVVETHDVDYYAGEE